MGVMRTEISGDTPAPEAASARAAYEPPMLVRVDVGDTENGPDVGADGELVGS